MKRFSPVPSLSTLSGCSRAEITSFCVIFLSAILAFAWLENMIFIRLYYITFFRSAQDLENEEISGGVVKGPGKFDWAMAMINSDKIIEMEIQVKTPYRSCCECHRNDDMSCAVTGGFGLNDGDPGNPCGEGKVTGSRRIAMRIFGSVNSDLHGTSL